MIIVQKHLAVFMIVSMAVAIPTQIFLPFPYGLAVALSVFVVFPLVYRKYVFKNGSMFSLGTPSGIKWHCITCGMKGNQRTCKRCGGNQFKAS